MQAGVGVLGASGMGTGDAEDESEESGDEYSGAGVQSGSLLTDFGLAGLGSLASRVLALHRFQSCGAGARQVGHACTRFNSYIRGSV